MCLHIMCTYDLNHLIVISYYREIVSHRHSKFITLQLDCLIKLAAKH